MEVRRARCAGACYGVQRALDMAAEAVDRFDSVCSLGPLIHNPVVVGELERKGLQVIDSLDGQAPEAVLIRSHGVTPQVKRQVEATGAQVIDATCPHVARAQRGAAELGTQGCCVLVIGEAGHPEVEGLVAYAQETNAKVVVVSAPDQIPADLYEPVGVVVQTTQKREAMQAVLDELESRGINAQVKKTICAATTQRQNAAAALAGEVDAMVVIGGRNSSNTTRLASICKDLCPRTFHIERATELERSWFDGCQTVGVTAGASTPDAQIDEVVSLLEGF